MMIRKVHKLMRDYCSGRPGIDLVQVHTKYFASLISIPNFIQLWDKLSAVLQYPKPELMRLEDNLVELIEINNSQSIFVSEFDDVYEILQVINHEYMYVAVDEKIEFSTIGDLLNFICLRFGRQTD